MYQALYRKYRPTTFDDVVGQEHITRTLKKQVQTGRLSHAYLFVGTRGTGKTTCAKILARAVNCEHPHDGDPCGECAACRGILDGGILDVVELDAASNNGVDNVRALRDEAIFSPASVKKRVYIIDEVHMLSTAAFNALLKILEEPPEHLLFILCTTELHKVLPTIVSRCQRHNFKRLTPADIAGRLRYVAEKEGIELTDDAAALLARLADGGMRDGLSLLDQCSAAEHIDEAAVLSAMGLMGSRKTAELLDAVCAGSSEQALALFDELWQAGKDPAAILDELGGLIRDVLLTQVAPQGCESLLSGAYPMKTLRYFAKKRSGAELMNDLNRLEQAGVGGFDPRRSAELCLVSLCVPDCGEDITALRARVARLERMLQSGVSVAAPAPSVSDVPPEKVDIIQESPPAVEDDDRPPLPDDSDMPPLPEEDFIPAAPVLEPAPEPMAKPEPKTEPKTEPKPAPAAAGTGDDSLWDGIVERLQGRVEQYIYAMMLPSSQTVGIVSGGTLTVHVSNPFAHTMLEQGNVLAAIRDAAAQVAGRPLTVTVTEEPAPARKPNEDKLAGLNRFANFKME